MCFSSSADLYPLVYHGDQDDKESIREFEWLCMDLVCLWCVWIHDSFARTNLVWGSKSIHTHTHTQNINNQLLSHPLLLCMHVCVWRERGGGGYLKTHSQQQKEIPGAYRFQVLITNYESIRADMSFLNKVSFFFFSLFFFLSFKFLGGGVGHVGLQKSLVLL
jgi:hypothetical protein